MIAIANNDVKCFQNYDEKCNEFKMNCEIKIVVLLIWLIKIFMTLNDFGSAMCRENQLLFCEAAQMLGDFRTKQGT